MHLAGTITARIRVCSGSRQLYLALTTAARLLMPRTSVDRQYLLDMLAMAVPQALSGRFVDAKALARIVRETVSGARRHWPRVPPGSAVLAHTWRDGSSALLCANGPEAPVTVWLEGICGPSGNLYWFDQQFEDRDFAGMEMRRDGSYWWATCPAREVAEGVWRAVLPCGEVALCGMDVWYPRPAKRWMEVAHVNTA